MQQETSRVTLDTWRRSDGAGIIDLAGQERLYHLVQTLKARGVYDNNALRMQDGSLSSVTQSQWWPKCPTFA